MQASSIPEWRQIPGADVGGAWLACAAIRNLTMDEATAGFEQCCSFFQPQAGQISDAMLFPCDSTQPIHWQRLIAIKQVLSLISYLTPHPLLVIKWRVPFLWSDWDLT
jgi:hypothetical protein